MIVVTRCHILRLKCTNFDIGWGSATDPAGELTALPKPVAKFNRPTSKRRQGRVLEGNGGRGKGDLLQGFRGKTPLRTKQRSFV